MAKRGQLNSVEKYFIEGNVDELEVEEIAKALDRTVFLVQKYIDTLPRAVSPEQPATPPEEPKTESPLYQLMGRKKRNEQYVATVMTPAASEYADNTRPQRLAQNKKIQTAIHKPKGD